ncbi:hypothetical protein ACFOQM_01175 [Paenibacillus sp. GCM10012307]|uniref:Butirosin biosynthesis protein H N-terminal domain-containing protein n=1 Tax=Paenibacillus roseus TaxID=2798579 RepID=A0A934MJH7_9BACL|nr:hypothetical protein [Paenibacillus roseus]MBJ6359935.1 hypothetical protein [Paenibacillus roseus]
MIQLPVNHSPIIKGRMHYAFMLSIITTFDNYEPWLYSHFINLQCNKLDVLDNIDNELRFVKCDTPHYYKAIIDYEMIKIPTLKQLDVDMHNFILNSLKNGKYIFINVDKYFIPQTLAYKQFSQVQEILVFGADIYNDYYTVLLYDDKEQYAIKKVTFEEMQLATHDLETGFWNEDIFLIWKPDDDFKYRCHMYAPDIGVIVQELTDYYYSRSSSEIVKLHLNMDLYDYGTSIYQLMKFNNIQMAAITPQDPAFRYPVISLNTLWEHKKIMTSRVEYLTRLGYLSETTSTIQAFRELEQDVLGLRQFVLKMQVKREFDAARINNRLDTIAEIEKPLIAQLIEELTRTVQTDKYLGQQVVT